MAVANTPEKRKYGGHDHKFYDKVPEELICNICTKPLLEPHLTVCCGCNYKLIISAAFKAQETKMMCCCVCQYKYRITPLSEGASLVSQ